MYLLMSHPRSGNTWVRYIIEEITGRPTEGYRGQDLYIKGARDRRKTSPALPICRKTHAFLRSGNPLVGTNWQGVILLYRNPFYVVDRELVGPVLASQKEYDYYMSLLVKYDAYDGAKIKVRYEELISNPKEAINKIIDFILDDSELVAEEVEDFLQNIDSHKEKSLDFYNRSYGESKTSKTNFVTTNLEQIEEAKAAWLPYLTEKYPDLMHYLEEYL